MIDALQKIFGEYQVNNTVRFNYETKLYAGQILTFESNGGKACLSIEDGNSTWNVK